MMKMKSPRDSLRKRGMAREEDIKALSGNTPEELEKALNSGSASERTAAVRLLTAGKAPDSRVAGLLARMLKTETALYTKIEICRALEKGDAETARIMLPLIGAIGNNRHKGLPDKVSGKKTYPLPRDIAARTLAKMKPEILPVLTDALEKENGSITAELIDAVGFMVFRNKGLASPQNSEKIYKILKNSGDNYLVFWKAVQCLSAFPSVKTLALLEKIKKGHKVAVIREEAARSEAFVITASVFKRG